MSHLALSTQSQRFLKDHVEQVEDLEILLLLRASPKREWDAIEVGRQIGLEPISASNRMMHLYLVGLLDHPEKAGRVFQYRHRPRPSLEKSIGELASLFEKAKFEVINQIIANQRSQLRHFADAFKVGRDPKDG